MVCVGVSGGDAIECGMLRRVCGMAACAWDVSGCLRCVGTPRVAYVQWYECGVV